jgi:hypothetical protein
MREKIEQQGLGANSARASCLSVVAVTPARWRPGSPRRGDYVLTLDADMSHEPAFVGRMWRAHTQADLIIASRYVSGGVTYTSFVRDWLSRVLN